jgi:uncharacterized protein (TIGR02271 family)
MSSHERHVLGQHGQRDDSAARTEDTGATLRLHEEQLAARKRTVEAGRVSLGTEVVEEEQTLEVPITREEVTIERHPVARRPSDEPITAASDALTVAVHEDQVAVDRQAVVYEEVSLGKRAVQETQHVADTVRKEVVDVDATGEVEVSDHATEQR